MIREFFGETLEAALQRAVQKLGISASQLRVQQLPGTFGQTQKIQKVGILVEYDETAVPREQSVSSEDDDTVERLQALREEPLARAKYVLEGLLQRLGIDTRVEAEESDGQLMLTVRFESSPIDFRRGEGRELRGAVQYLVNRALADIEGERRVIVDFGGTLADRSQKLQRLANEVVERVAAIGQPLQVQLMDSQDRRLLHTALLDQSTIRTESQGEGRFRVLCVWPVEPTAE